jgi:hypothetical protein
MYTGSASIDETLASSNSLASIERATFRNGWLHKQIAQPYPTNCGLAWQCCFLPLYSKVRCFLDLSHSKCNFLVTESIEICDI